MDEMVSVLRDDIISGKRQVGDYLPSERALGKQFRISNKSVREALSTLQSEGLIEKIPKVGSRVASLPDDKAIRVRFAYHETLVNEADMSHLISMFHKQYPHIRIQPVPLMSRHYNDFTQLMDADLMDVLSVNNNDLLKIISNDCVDLLDTQQPNPDIYPYLTKGFVIEGELKAQPFVFSPVILCYNKEHLAECNVLEPDSSWTWDDLLQAADKLTTPNERFGFYTLLQSRNRWPVFLLQSGMKFPLPGEQPIEVKDSPWMEAIKICRNLMTYQSLMPIFDREEDTEELFLQGRASIIMTTYFRLNDLKKAPFEYDIAPLPYSTQPKTMLLSIGLALLSTSRQKEASKTFIDFIVSQTSQQSIRTRTLSIPAMKSAAEWSGKETMFRPSRFHMHREIVPTFSRFSDLNIPEELSYQILKEAKYFWSGLFNEDTLSSRLQESFDEQYKLQKQH
jgi:multiple sugar transport system substrate-binding protein